MSTEKEDLLSSLIMANKMLQLAEHLRAWGQEQEYQETIYYLGLVARKNGWRYDLVEQRYVKEKGEEQR
jgi:hypothetical protein